MALWKPPSEGQRGGQRKYSDLAIKTALTLRLIFSLGLRQTEGFVASLLELMDLDLEAPDHTTLSRRSKKVALPKLTANSGDPVHLIIDSTGLKISGEGPWTSEKYPGRKRQGWRKLHLGVDAEGTILAHVLTDRDGEDGATGPDLIEQVEGEISRLTGDGAYDRRAIYDALEAAGSEETQVVIPPRSDAVDSGTQKGLWSQRDAAVRTIAASGRRQWERESGYRQQSRVENTFFRYKQIFGDRLHARDLESQQIESLLGCHILNRMFDLGRPESRPVIV